jgi:outer membrane protein assembly factor BamB
MKVLLTISFLFFLLNLFSQEIVEFRGVGRTGHYSETGLLKQWPADGPEILLKIEDIGKGYSNPIVVDNIIFVTGIKEDTTDVISAFSNNGELLWETNYGRSWTKSYIDSRSTPTYEKGKLYVSSGTGQVNCIDAKTGKIIWQIDAIKKYNGEIYTHGDAENPLLVDDKVVFTTGGEENTMVAFNKTDGSLVWKTKSLGGAKSYATPVVINHNGMKLILTQTANNLIAINPDNGEIIWHYNLIQYHLHEQGVGANTNPPIYNNGAVFVTSGYNHPGIKLSLSADGKSVSEVWKNDTIDTHHGGVVLVDGNLYGSNWQNNSKGKWASVNWETGRTNWEEEWFNKGSTVYADGMLYIYEEKSGNVALVEPSAEKLKIKSTFKITEGEGPHWAHPAIYDGKLYIRHGNVLMVYNVRDKV